MKNRNSQQIICSILENTQTRTPITKLMTTTNINHSRIKSFLSKLVDNQLIDFDNGFLITEQGRRYLEAYKKFSILATSFGLEL